MRNSALVDAVLEQLHPLNRSYCTSNLCACMGCCNSVVSKEEFDDWVARKSTAVVNWQFSGIPASLGWYQVYSESDESREINCMYWDGAWRSGPGGDLITHLVAKQFRPITTTTQTVYSRKNSKFSGGEYVDALLAAPM